MVRIAAGPIRNLGCFDLRVIQMFRSETIEQRDEILAGNDIIIRASSDNKLLTIRCRRGSTMEPILAFTRMACIAGMISVRAKLEQLCCMRRCVQAQERLREQTPRRARSNTVGPPP